MARNASIHRLRLSLSHVDRGVYADLQHTVARHPSETVERMVVRILAFALRYAEGLEFGRGVSTQEEPDLWRREPDGRIAEWIEVGRPDARRLIAAARKADRCLLFAFGDRDGQWRRAQIDGLAAPANLCIAALDDAFVAALAADAGRQIEWSATISEGTLYVATASDSFESAPEVWLGHPLA